MALESAWIPLAGALFGGVGLKMLEHWLGRSKMKIDEATKIRDELRVEITALREEIKKVELESDIWRDRYYTLREQQLATNKELVQALDHLKKDGPTP